MKKLVCRISSILFLILAAVIFGEIINVKASGFLDFTNVARIVFGIIDLICISLSAFFWKSDDERFRRIKVFLWIIAVVLIAFAVFGSRYYNEPAKEEVSLHQTSDYPAAIMVEDEIYLLSSEPIPAEIEWTEGAIIEYPIFYIETFPQKNGETNFSRESELLYVRVEEGMVFVYANGYETERKDRCNSYGDGKWCTVFWYRT